jgi:hypothetical protein
VAPEREVDGAVRFVGRGVNRVLTTADIGERLPGLLTELGTVSERVRVRVQVHVDLNEGARSETWLSENISLSGMLVRTTAEEAKGTELGVEFKVPGDDLPIHARAEVVRATTFGRESFSGLGLRFLSFVGEGQHRLELFLHSRNRESWLQ